MQGCEPNFKSLMDFVIAQLLDFVSVICQYVQKTFLDRLENYGKTIISPWDLGWNQQKDWQSRNYGWLRQYLGTNLQSQSKTSLEWSPKYLSENLRPRQDHHNRFLLIRWSTKTFIMNFLGRLRSSGEIDRQSLRGATFLAHTRPSCS